MRPCERQYSRDQAIAQARIPKYPNASEAAPSACASIDFSVGVEGRPTVERIKLLRISCRCLLVAEDLDYCW
jgi:hypothetical protein